VADAAPTLLGGIGDDQLDGGMSDKLAGRADYLVGGQGGTDGWRQWV
jgi:hypothetical protein